MNTTIYELINSRYVRRFNYLELRDIIYRTIIYVLLNNFKHQLEDKVVIIEDGYYNDIYNTSFKNEDHDYIKLHLLDKDLLDIFLAILPMIEIYIEKSLSDKRKFIYKLFLINVNIISVKTTQISIKFTI